MKKFNIKLKKPKIESRKYTRKLYLLAVAGMVGLGGYIAYMGNASDNPLIIVVGFVGLAIGFMLFRKWRNMGGVRILKKRTADGEEVIEEEPANSLVIYPSCIDFIYVKDALGQAQKCHNDGKYYYVFKAEKEGAKLEEFRLPDDDESKRYYCPREFANPVTMPSNKKYFTWSATTMQKVYAGIMFGVIGALILGIITIP